jgi:DNA-binding CsgD family transcriptional regulator
MSEQPPGSIPKPARETEWIMGAFRRKGGTKGRVVAASPALQGDLELTSREAEVLGWVVHGKTNAEIGEILGTSPRTIAKHLERVYRKLGVETRTGAAVRWVTGREKER